MATKKRIAYWGLTQIGKTALLATALYRDSAELARVRRNGPQGSINQSLFDVFLRLNQNQWVLPTSADWTGLSLVTEAGAEIEIVDIRGGLALEMHSPATRELLASCDGALFLAEYKGTGAGAQMAAIEAAARETEGKVHALAFTKCERWLAYDDPVWDGGNGWIEHTPLWAAHSETLKRFRDAAWPTSSFGYDSVRALPAVIIGEMGQMLPFRINPRNVAKPLAWMLRQMESL